MLIFEGEVGRTSIERWSTLLSKSSQKYPQESIVGQIKHQLFLQLFAPQSDVSIRNSWCRHTLNGTLNHDQNAIFPSFWRQPLYPHLGLRWSYFIQGHPKTKYNYTTIKWIMEICGAGRQWAGIIYLTHTPHIATIYGITKLAERGGIYWIAISKTINNQQPTAGLKVVKEIYGVWGTQSSENEEACLLPTLNSCNKNRDMAGVTLGGLRWPYLI